MGKKRRLVGDEFFKTSVGLGKKRRLVLVDEDEDEEDGVLDENSWRRIEELIDRSYYFDRLPDDLVMRIVDRLSLKVAAKTCILSRRFHRVFKTSLQYRKNLDFQGSGCLEFLQFVNHILQRYEGTKVDSLRIALDGLLSEKRTMWGDDFEFELNEDFKNNWLTFARDKLVQSLEIDLSCSRMGLLLYYPQFPTFRGWNQLTALSLNMVRVSDADLEHGLKSHLVNLESLFIQEASLLKRVVVASPKLKKLEIRFCSEIRSIAIDVAPNLECFIYYEAFRQGLTCFIDHVVMSFNFVPKLSHVSFDPKVVSQSSMEELVKVETLEKLELLAVNKASLPPQLAMCKAWDRLTSLSMKYINAVDADIEHLMLSLEALYIYRGSNLRKISVKSLKLKRLELRHCCSIYSIDIDSAPNLEFFCYQGTVTYLGKSVVCVRDAPKLSHVTSTRSKKVHPHDVELYFSSEMISL